MPSAVPINNKGEGQQDELGKTAIWVAGTLPDSPGKTDYGFAVTHLETDSCQEWSTRSSKEREFGP